MHDRQMIQLAVNDALTALCAKKPIQNVDIIVALMEFLAVQAKAANMGAGDFEVLARDIYDLVRLPTPDEIKSIIN